MMPSPHIQSTGGRYLQVWCGMAVGPADPAARRAVARDPRDRGWGDRAMFVSTGCSLYLLSQVDAHRR